MTPTTQDFLSAACKWRGEHNGIAYELSWHGRSDYSPEGTWCWYIMLAEEQFYPEDWSRLRLPKEDKQYFNEGNFHRHWNYDQFPDVEPHGGWTFGEMTVYLGKDGKEYEQAKVGCDYAHLWDREGGYWQGKSDIERDAKHSIDLFLKMFPRRRLRCGYSGKWDDAEQFYTAKNGALVHRSYESKLRESPGWWEHWQPAVAA